MSGRGSHGRSGRGTTRGGRGFGHGSGRFNSRRSHDNRNKNSENKTEFVPHCGGQTQRATCDAVAEHIIQKVQNDFKHGTDMAKALREMKHNDNPGGVKPERETVNIASDDKKLEAET